MVIMIFVLETETEKEKEGAMMSWARKAYPGEPCAVVLYLIRMIPADTCYRTLDTSRCAPLSSAHGQ